MVLIRNENRNPSAVGKWTFLLFASACLAFDASAAGLPSADWYVDDDATSEGADGSAGRPFPTIQQAVSSASANQTIYVAEGVYTNGMYHHTSGASYVRVYIDSKPGLKLVGAGRGKSFIVGSRDPSAELADDVLTETRTNLVQCVYVKDSPDMVIEGFTIKDGEAFEVSGNGGSSTGGGLYVSGNGTDVYLVDCDILHCCARVGGGMYGGTAVRCRFEGNYAMSGSVSRYGRLINCIITRNLSKNKLGLLNGGAAYNCTIFGNPLKSSTVALHGDTRAYNCVIGLSSPTALGVETNGTATVTDCVLASSAPKGYRQFLAPAVDDFRLLSESDAVGVGEPAHLEMLNLPAGIDAFKDFNGEPIRADGNGRINAGAIQAKVSPAGGALAFIDGQYEIDGHVNTNVLATYVYPEFYPTQYCVRACLGEGEHLYRVERYNPGTGGLTRDYPASVPYRDGTMWMMPPMDTDIFITNKSVVASKVFWVDPQNGADANTGTSANEPFAKISTAIDAAGNSKSVIYLLPGEYANEELPAPTAVRGNFRLVVPGKNTQLRIVSTDGPENTVIRGRADDSVEGGFGPNSLKGAILYKNTILQGVTISDCYSGSGADSSHLGAAVFFDTTDGDIAPPQLIDCVITNCHAKTGVTINYGVMRRCRIYDSSAENSSLIYDAAQEKHKLPVFACHLRGLDSSSDYGAIGGDARVWQSTIAGTLGDGRVTDANNVSWNSIWYGGRNIASGAVFTNCFVYNPSGTAIGVYEKTDPLFADNSCVGELCANSPAIGAGCGFTSDNYGADYWKFACGDVNGKPIAFTGGKPTLGAYQIPDTEAVRAVVDIKEPSNGGWVLSDGEYGVHELSEGDTLSFIPADGSRPCVGVKCGGVEYLFTNAPNETVTLDFATVARSGYCTVEGIYTSDWYVDDDGDDSATGFLPTHPKRTLATAAKLLSQGDTLWVLPGVYDEGCALHATKGVESRVVVKEKTSVKSLEGPEKTIIMGAAATGEHATNEYGCGTNAVRCAYVSANALLSGFTLTGGRTYTNETGTAAFAHGGGVLGHGRGEGCRVENCIISNNVAYYGGAVMRADVFASVIRENIGFSAGSAMREANAYGCYMSGNLGASVVSFPCELMECTVDADNKRLTGTVPTLVGNPVNGFRIFNSVIMGDFDITGSNSGSVSNCVCGSGSSFSDSVSTGNVQIVDFATQTFADGVPVPGANVAVDAAEESLCTNAFSAVDLRGFPRVSNGRRDIGAFEADWRPVYADILGASRWLEVTSADSHVVAGVDCVAISDGSLSALISNPSGRNVTYSIPVSVTGSGTLTVTCGGGTLGTVTLSDGLKELEFASAAAELSLVFRYAPGENDSGCAVINSITRSGMGFMFLVR